MDYLKFKSILNAKFLDIYAKIMSFIECNYNMDILYDGKNEIKVRRSNKTLVTFYVMEDKLTVLIIFGKKEREVFEDMSANFSEYINDYYNNSKTYHDGKWMFIDIKDDMYVDEIIKLIKIKKKPNPNVITMCGYKCDLCKAHSKNIKKQDKRTELSTMWNKYYDLKIPPRDIFCDGCRCKKKDVKRIDDSCPVRACVIDKSIHSCADCDSYPCDIFKQRRGLSKDEAKEKLKGCYCNDEYNEYLLAFDNKTRVDRYRKYLTKNHNTNINNVPKI